MKDLSTTNFMPGDRQTVLIDGWETITPIGGMILVKPDEFKSVTKSGIVLPNNIRIPTCRGRVLAVSEMINLSYEQMGVPDSARVKVMDYIIFQYGTGMPESFENSSGGKLLIAIGNVLGKVSKTKNKRDQNGQENP